MKRLSEYVCQWIKFSTTHSTRTRPAGLGTSSTTLKLGGGDLLKNKMADTNLYFLKVVPLDPKMNTGNLNFIFLVVLLY